MHPPHLLLVLSFLLTLLTLLPTTTPLPLTSNSTSLSTTLTTTTALTLAAPPSCPRYRIRHGGHLRYRLSRLHTACRPPRRKEMDASDKLRARTAGSHVGEGRAGSSAGRVVGGGTGAADL